MKLFISDLKLYIGKITFYGLIKAFLNINVWMVMIFRISSFFYKRNLFFIAKIFWLFNRIVFAIDIDPGANLGPGLKLIHPMSIVVGRNVFSEGNLILYQNVTIGGSMDKTKIFEGKELLQPYLKKNIVVFASAVIIGPIVIQENVIVGANAVVSKDIPAFTLVYNQNQFKEHKEIYKAFKQL